MKTLQKNSHYFALIVALSAMAGSMFFSEVLQYPPCVLCWYQRVCMYPIVGILALGIYFRDKYVYRSVLLLSGIGMLISLYHNLLYYQVLPEAAAPCRLGVSCTTKFIEYFRLYHYTLPFRNSICIGYPLYAILQALSFEWREKVVQRTISP